MFSCHYGDDNVTPPWLVYPSPSDNLPQLSKIKPSLEQIRGVLEDCFYQGADLEASIDQRHLEKCSLVELQVKQNSRIDGIHTISLLSQCS